MQVSVSAPYRFWEEDAFSGFFSDDDERIVPERQVLQAAKDAGLARSSAVNLEALVSQSQRVGLVGKVEDEALLKALSAARIIHNTKTGIFMKLADGRRVLDEYWLCKGVLRRSIPTIAQSIQLLGLSVFFFSHPGYCWAGLKRTTGQRADTCTRGWARHPIQ